MDSRNEQNPTCEVVHETNKAHFRNLLPNRFLPSSVGRASEWWSGGLGFKPYWDQVLTKLILFWLTLDLSNNLTEMRQICLSWKKQIFHRKETINITQRPQTKLEWIKMQVSYPNPTLHSPSMQSIPQHYKINKIIKKQFDLMCHLQPMCRIMAQMFLAKISSGAVMAASWSAGIHRGFKTQTSKGYCGVTKGTQIFQKIKQFEA